MEFSAPATSGESVTPAEVEGHLLVVEPTEYKTDIATVHGPKDAVVVTVHDIKTQTTTVGALWFSGVLVGSLKGQIGKRVLGIMGKGNAKPGQSAPWVLNDASGDPAAVTAATTYLTGQTAATLTAPATAKQSELDAAIGNLTSAGLVSHDAPF